MRVLVVHNSYQIPGGEDAVVGGETELLQQNGVDCRLYSVTNDSISSIAAKLSAGGNRIYNFRARSSVLQAIRDFRPDVVHVHNFFPLLSPSIFDACRDASVPSILTLHNFRLLCPSALLYEDDDLRERSLHRPCWWTVPRRAYRNSMAATLALSTMVEFHKRSGTWQSKVDRFLALSEWARAKFIEGGLPADRILVKPNAVARPAGVALKRRAGALFVGRLDNQKGIKTLLTAWNEVDYPLRVIGDGPLAPLVQKAAGGKIEYLGRQPRDVVQREMLAARFLVLPSSGHEMFPLTVVEAFAAGLPVLCSDLASLSSLVVDGVSGFTFASNNPSALAARARWALRSQNALDEVSRNASQIYSDRYSPEANFDALLKIYSASKTASQFGEGSFAPDEAPSSPVATPQH